MNLLKHYFENNFRHFYCFVDVIVMLFLYGMPISCYWTGLAMSSLRLQLSITVTVEIKTNSAQNIIQTFIKIMKTNCIKDNFAVNDSPWK